MKLHGNPDTKILHAWISLVTLSLLFVQIKCGYNLNLDIYYQNIVKETKSNMYKY